MTDDRDDTIALWKISLLQWLLAESRWQNESEYTDGYQDGWNNAQEDT